VRATPRLLLGLLTLAAPAAWAQETKTFAGVGELLQASGSLADGVRVRVRRAVVTGAAISTGGQLRDMDEVANEHGFGWEAVLIEPRLDDPHLDLRVGESAAAAGNAALRVRLITRAYYDDGDGELVEAEVRHAPLRAGNVVELRGRLLRAGAQRLLFVEPVLGDDAVHADGVLRVLGNADGSALAPVLRGAVYGTGVVEAGGTVTFQGYFLEASTRLRATAGGQAVDLPVESVNGSRTRLVARVPATLPHGAATVSAVGGQGQATLGVVHAPVITSVAPTSVRAGERIVIEGRALTDLGEIGGISEEQPTIRIDGTSNLQVVELSAGRIVAEVSVYEQPGPHELVIQNQAGSAKVALRIDEATGPVITSVEPAGAYLLLRGADFGTSPRVLFLPAGASAEVAGEVVLRSANALLVRRPAGAGQGTVKVVGGVLNKAGPAVPFDASSPGLVGGLTPH
jgi:hypothetical protein